MVLAKRLAEEMILTRADEQKKTKLRESFCSRINRSVDFITLTAGSFLRHMLSNLRKECQNILTSTIEREIRLLAFCLFIIILISLVTIHFYRLLLN